MIRFFILLCTSAGADDVMLISFTKPRICPASNAVSMEFAYGDTIVRRAFCIGMSACKNLSTGPARKNDGIFGTR